MIEKKSDRDLLLIARANLDSAKRDLKETDEVYINIALFNISQAVEKTLKFLCSYYDIAYDYSYFFGRLINQLEDKEIEIPKLVCDKVNIYSKWATIARYRADQMVQRKQVQKHIDCIDAWITKIEEDFGFIYVETDRG